MLAHLEADRARVTDLEAQILHLERSLSALRNEKTRAQERLDSYKYPVLTLPNEIVSEIFVHFLPTYPRFPSQTGILSPTMLTQICRTWREIALGTPALWSVMSDNADPSSLLQAHVFNIWLNRSRSCPLSLQFGLGRLEITPVLEFMVPHRARWERLELYFLSPSHLPILDGPMPLLRYLELHLDPPAVGATSVVFKAPLLHTVTLNASAASKVILPWAQLTSLALFYVYPNDCVPILQQTSNLVRCELRFFFFDPNDNLPASSDITLPCLESLILRNAGLDSATDFLETLIVPALRSLEIPEQLLADPIDSLTVFISKSSCKLEELLITGTGSVPLSLYCNAFPSIRNISFKGRDFE
ncbi:hypothetical protein B0H13DRAFT_2550128 [Mycena leptocephala]|nr:hypothetical protein B0H13DRAFT_2550128 [Mycena leptocephala]